MRKNILILAVFGVLVIAPAESAIASTATAVDGNLRYTAASGEANDVGFARVATNTYRVTDTGTVIVAGTGCTQESPNVVKCTMASRKVIIASLGDQNDNATAAATRTTQIFGEDGNDRLIGSNARDTLDGGNGDDAITGGGGNDRLTGGPGNDQITGDAGRDGLAGGDGNDLLDGGADADSEGGGNGDDVLREGDAANGADTLAGNGGSDTVDYAGRHDAVSVRVDDVADDGDTSTSEHDNVRTSIERVNGGSGSDVLVGRDGKPDTLVGGPGDDVLDPRRGNDQVDGGPGIDQIRVRDLSVDNVTCGDEVDSVAADSRDLTGTDCENVRRDASMSISVVGSARYPSIALRLACPETAFKSCGGKVIVTSLKKLGHAGKRRSITFGQRRFNVAAGGEAVLSIRIRAGTLRYLGPRGLFVRARLSAFDGAGPARKDAVRFRLFRG